MLLVGALLTAGCSAIPSVGEVHDVRKVGDVANPAQPQAPEAGQLPDQIVRGFIQAGADTNDAPYEAAKQFLTPKAQSGWQPATSSVVVLDDLYRLQTADTSVVTMRGTRLAVLDPDRSYRALPPQPYVRTMTLVKVDGEWRINNPPNEVLIQEQDFDQAFRMRTVYFLDQTGSVVVPDPRYLEAGLTQANRITRLTNLLLAGPTARLRPAVLSELGTSARLRSAVTTDDQGVVHVDLTGVSPESADARGGLAAQIVWTLSNDADRVAITLDGVPLGGTDNAPGASVYTMQSVDSYNPDRVAGTGQVSLDPWFIDPSGAIISLTGDRQPMWGRVGTGSDQVENAAISAANGTLAAVVLGAPDKPAGRQLLLGRPLDLQPTSPVLVADTLTPPTFTRTGDEVWVVQNGATKPKVIAITTSGSLPRGQVRADELTGKGEVTQLVLSPDGVRVAVVAGNRLYVGVVVAAAPDAAGSGKPGPVIQGLTEIAPSLTNVGPVAFAASNSLVVGASTGAGLRVLYQLGVDGSGVLRTSQNGFFGDVTSVSVTPNQPPLMSYGGRIYELDGAWRTGTWTAPLNLPALEGTAPFYPG